MSKMYIRINPESEKNSWRTEFVKECRRKNWRFEILNYERWKRDREPMKLSSDVNDSGYWYVSPSDLKGYTTEKEDEFIIDERLFKL